MAYLNSEQLREMGFKSLGKNVKISDKASIYNADQIEIGDNSRIDDFCIISGHIQIGSYCHITPMCLLAGGIKGIQLEDFCTLAYGVKVFSQSDDYSGETMVNSLIPKKYKNEKMEKVTLKRQVIVGAGSIIMPGVTIAEGCSIGAMTLVNKSTEAWGIYVGNPARRVKDRKQDLLLLEKTFLEEESINDSI
ncbi:acyltransferase [Psychrobacter okhotskensis]|jgi:acetyltransferase-like isoleucine patch superfamily enzyme|uniref:acyltransferase n=2 Tax=Psychrobacter TaxID=497 RepID=UPI00156334BE|nr:acyltransferase [Psychrobacter okhotskensis]NRD70225.1 acyltransferase [Psychrobacter okhotskensis]